MNLGDIVASVTVTVRSPDPERPLRAYAARQIRRGRSAAAVAEDPYLVNRACPAVRLRILADACGPRRGRTP